MTTMDNKDIIFKVTDETTNRKGFKVITSGIDTSNYNNNNVLLFNHENAKPIGLAEYYVEGDSGFAKLSFDEQDEDAMKIKGKVEKGHLKTTSIGIAFDYADIEIVDDIAVIKKSELLEISIVSVPANPNATVQNFSAEELEKNSEKNSILYMSANLIQTKKNNNMDFKQFDVKDELELVSKFETLTNSISVLEASTKELEKSIVEKDSIIEVLNVKATEIEAVKNSLEVELSIIKESEKLSVIDKAITEGYFNIAQRESIIELAKLNFDMVKSMIENAVKVVAPSKDFSKLGNTELSADRKDWNFADWVKKDFAGLSAMKSNDNDAYVALYNKHYSK